MTHASVHGSCLCGAVRFEVAPPFARMVHCHCSRCRKSSGAAHATNLIVDPGQLRWLAGEDLIARYDLASAKSFGKWFCSHCGSTVPRVSRDRSFAIVPAGTLDEAPPLAPSDHIFWSDRPEWGCSSGALPTHERYPESWRRA